MTIPNLSDTQWLWSVVIALVLGLELGFLGAVHVTTRAKK